MTAKVRGILLREETLEAMLALSDEQRGKLVLALFAESGLCAAPKLDGMTRMAFVCIAPGVRRAQASADRRREASVENGRKGGRPRKQPAVHAGGADIQYDVDDPVRAGEYGAWHVESDKPAGFVPPCRICEEPAGSGKTISESNPGIYKERHENTPPHPPSGGECRAGEELSVAAIHAAGPAAGGKKAVVRACSADAADMAGLKASGIRAACTASALAAETSSVVMADSEPDNFPVAAAAGSPAPAQIPAQAAPSAVSSAASASAPSAAALSKASVCESGRSGSESGRKSRSRGNSRAELEAAIDAYTEDAELREALRDFREMRVAIHAPLTGRAMRDTFAELDRLAADAATRTAIVRQSVQRAWRGVFALRESRAYGGRSSGAVQGSQNAGPWNNWGEVNDGLNTKGVGW